MDSVMKGLMGQCPLLRNFWARTALYATSVNARWEDTLDNATDRQAWRS